MSVLSNPDGMTYESQVKDHSQLFTTRNYFQKTISRMGFDKAGTLLAIVL